MEKRMFGFYVGDIFISCRKDSTLKYVQHSLGYVLRHVTAFLNTTDTRKASDSKNREATHIRYIIRIMYVHSIIVCYVMYNI